MRAVLGALVMFYAAVPVLAGGFASTDIWTFAIRTLTFAAGFLLVAGLLTPIAAITVTCAVVWSLWAQIDGHADLPGGVARALAIADAAALVALGPGAFSIDARLFGRREIRIPRAPRH